MTPTETDRPRQSQRINKPAEPRGVSGVGRQRWFALAATTKLSGTDPGQMTLWLLILLVYDIDGFLLD